jgi:secondary thiamine-phosphate synthase enzyme
MTASTLEVATRGRGLVDITAEVQAAIRRSGAQAGLCHLFLHHTSASLLITENADPEVHRDLERLFSRLAPDGDPLFRHDAEGPDDMPAHVRTALTAVSLAVPIRDGRCDLGTWQSIYVWEHRHAPHRRRVTATILGG